MNKELMVKTLRNTLGAAVYIFLVSQLMQNGAKLFGENDNIFTPFVILLLFSLSAAIVGGLVYGQSVILFLNKKNDEGVKAAIYSTTWLGIYTALVILALMFAKQFGL